MRETYVFRDGKIIAKDQAAPLSGVFTVMPDISPFITQEGTPISSRSHLRAYEQRMGVRQVGNDIKLTTRGD